MCVRIHVFVNGLYHLVVLLDKHFRWPSAMEANALHWQPKEASFYRNILYFSEFPVKHYIHVIIYICRHICIICVYSRQMQSLQQQYICMSFEVSLLWRIKGVVWGGSFFIQMSININYGDLNNVYILQCRNILMVGSLFLLVRMMVYF